MNKAGKIKRRQRIAAFGFRNFPPREGSAGADKFAMELLPRLARRGFQVTAYNRIYPGMAGQDGAMETIDGVDVRYFKTVKRKGFDTLLHSMRVAYDIIRHNRADIIHIQNGGNSIFGAILRLFGKRTYVSQDGIDWTRDKWPWYAKGFLWLSAALTARVHNRVIFDNIFAREEFERRFKRSYDFLPFGADVKYDEAAETVLERFGLVKDEYFLFVGRFIPDKGLHWLVPAFEKLATNKKLVLVGGSPNPSGYEADIRATQDSRILFAGFVYGAQVHALMRNAYAYVQPSAIEGLSPVILEAAYLGAPIICSDIPQNKYGMVEHATYFSNGSTDDLNEKLRWALDTTDALKAKGAAGAAHVARMFSWDSVVDQHVALFLADDPDHDDLGTATADSSVTPT
jgi:glycosyltransferase involved in cell wall biosynthesis